MKTRILLLAVLGALSATAQTHLAWQPILPAETSCITPGGHIVRSLNLPDGTAAYLLRITVAGQAPDTTLSLFNSVKNQPVTEAQNLANSQLSTTDSAQCDIFLFNEQKQATLFASKQEGWLFCHSYKEVSAACYYTTQCRNAVAIGFSNKTHDTLYLRFEIVALVDPSISLHLSSAFAQIYYGECLKSDTAYRLYKQQLPDYCGCVAQKIDKDYKHLLVLLQQNPGDESIVKLGLQCATQLTTTAVSNRNEETLQQLLTLRNQNNAKDLINFCQAQIKAGNDIQEIYNQLGWEFLRTKQFEKAKQYLSRAQLNIPVTCIYKATWPMPCC